MKPTSITCLLVLSLLQACKTPSRNGSLDTAIPKALQEKQPRLVTDYSRGGDLVNELYKEHVEASEDLRNLEAAIEALPQHNADSTGRFRSYHARNQSYYAAAERQAAGIRDSLLRLRVQAMLGRSQASYLALTSASRAILDSIDMKSAHVEDLHILVKIPHTLPMIEAFQRKGRPDSASMLGHLGELDGVIGELDGVIGDLNRQLR